MKIQCNKGVFETLNLHWTREIKCSSVMLIPTEHNPLVVIFCSPCLLSFLTFTPPFISIILQDAFLVFFCAVCMLHVAQSEDEETDYEMNDSD